MPWILWLAWRHGGIGTLAAANPGFEDGGFVGESKFAILSALPRRWTVPAALIAPGQDTARARALDATMQAQGWHYPLVLKPDVGQKGVGVRHIATSAEARHYLGTEPGLVIAQPYHPGPYEVGIFY